MAGNRTKTGIWVAPSDAITRAGLRPRNIDLALPLLVFFWLPQILAQNCVPPESMKPRLHGKPDAAALTQSRADWLRGRVKNEDDSLTGLWIDSFGGTLEIVQEKDRLFFEFEVVRGPTFHMGSIAGVATWNPPLGWFSDKGRDKEKTEETNLAFVSRGALLEVIGAQTSYYHGARAYFDGGYCKVGALDEKRRAEIVKEAEAGVVEDK